MNLVISNTVSIPLKQSRYDSISRIAIENVYKTIKKELLSVDVNLNDLVFSEGLFAFAKANEIEHYSVQANEFMSLTKMAESASTKGVKLIGGTFFIDKYIASYICMVLVPSLMIKGVNTVLEDIQK